MNRSIVLEYQMATYMWAWLPHARFVALQNFSNPIFPKTQFFWERASSSLAASGRFEKCPRGKELERNGQLGQFWAETGIQIWDSRHSVRGGSKDYGYKVSLLCATRICNSQATLSTSTPLYLYLYLYLYLKFATHPQNFHSCNLICIYICICMNWIWLKFKSPPLSLKFDLAVGLKRQRIRENAPTQPWPHQNRHQPRKGFGQEGLLRWSSGNN